MRIINKHVNIIKYLPEFMQKFKEMQQITSSENIDLQEIWYEIDKLMNNQFIESCDLYGITLFEKLLDIIPNENISLEVRKFNVLLNWNGDLPYTYKNLIKKLNFVQGKENYVITTNFNEYELNLDLIDTDFSKTDLLKSTIDRWIPCNISVTITNKNYRESKLELPSIIYVRNQITNVISMRNFDFPQYNSNLKIGILGIYKKINELGSR